MLGNDKYYLKNHYIDKRYNNFNLETITVILNTLSL